ncbi:hypothetical protein [Aureimonas pseudogalii]|uniref:DNA-binding protein n=1 Tax=Aureimonas pseudogalii TaxID=1744844 RepID=A0A7W6H4A3_9HYPH|nr:hypothetical protein [Aureimonas pseudogalii]MBB3997863.1 hypothetical protein [Aureimonas pseudogalii]
MEDDAETTTRKYIRLTETEWAECEALWETGDATLAELADQYGVAVRTLQSRFERHGVVKGRAASALAADVRERVNEAMGDPGDLASRAIDIRELTFANAEKIERLIMAQLATAQTDPGAAYKAGTAIKTLSLAAGALQRLHDLKRSALGLSDSDVLGKEIPELVIRDITTTEIEIIQNGGEDDADIESEIITEAEARRERAFAS